MKIIYAFSNNNRKQDFKKALFVFIALFYAQLSTAQNAKIGATAAVPNASAMLDIDGITGLAQAKGLLTPRVTNAQRLAMNPLPAAAQGLLVYQTDVVGANLEGFYYNISTTVVPNWVYLEGRGGWLITGNNNVTAANNFIGTLVNEDFLIKTNGAAAVNERMRVLRTGEVIVNNTVVGANAGDVFSAYASGTTNGTANTSAIGNFAVNGYSAAGGIGVYGENTGTGIGVYGNAVNRGVEGDANLAAGLGVFGTNAFATGNAVGVQGQSASVNGLAILGITNTALANPGAGTAAYGVYGQANGPAATTGTLIGVRGSSNTAITSGPATGVYGSSASLTGFGMQAVNSNASGTGILVVGNNAAGQYLAAGSGAAISGTSVGTFSRATAANSTGALITSNGAGLFTLGGTGSAISGSSTNTGVVGWATSAAAATRSGGYFDCNAGASFAYVGAISAAGIAYKINGNGLVATIVKDVNNQNVNLVCPEAPEALFQDYGQGQLTNGSVHITLDPILSKNIVVSEAHPLRVFVQLRGDCKGVYVTNETANGFDVIELQNGNSNTPFIWTVSANRADETLNDGTVSHYSSLRFIPGPAAAPRTELQAGNDVTTLSDVQDVQMQSATKNKDLKNKTTQPEILKKK
ncbi:MAG: hypothetical protein ABIT08_11145 [Bacteroidia bacterium]